jgi:ubiquinone/menaquinone biosynthesis C-methylase UbiE/uncharacterized protein YbaR (Trm112 family)
MESFKHIQKIREIYEAGGNVIEHLKGVEKRAHNTIEDILISYDFQAGSYIKGYADNVDFTLKYTHAIANIINKMETVNSIIEVGVGEATTLAPLVKQINHQLKNVLGFDISWSRLKYAKELLNDLNIKSVKLFTANLFEIPLPDGSVDVVYTSHSIEPNGGQEEPALKELYRITKKYLILLEPSFEFANEEARQRMKKHGYVKALYDTAKKLNYNIVEHRLFDYSANPLNPTGLLIIKKDEKSLQQPNIVCPVTRSELTAYSEHLLYSKEGHLAYPIIESIPCLLKENAILASHLFTNYNEFKKTNNIEFIN